MDSISILDIFCPLISVVEKALYQFIKTTESPHIVDIDLSFYYSTSFEGILTLKMDESSAPEFLSFDSASQQMTIDPEIVN